MQIESIANIQIAANRQRREFEPEALSGLSESIRKSGLLHPIVIRRDASGCTLVAGERRMRAIQDLWMMGGTVYHDSQALAEGFVPVVNLGDLDPLAAEEAELEENVVRADLTWQERADAETRLHMLRSKQAAANGEVHTIADTAKETRGSDSGHHPNQIRKSLIVSRQMADPDVAKAKSLDDAFKVIRNKEEQRHHAELSISIGKTFSAKDHDLLLEDCLIWLAGARADQYDVILTDPPYGMGADEFGDAGGILTTDQHAYSDSLESFRALMAPFAHESFRVAKPQAHLYAFCDLDNYHYLKALFVEAGWKVHRTPLVWHKTQAQRVPWPESGPRRHYELCLYAVKGGKRVNKIASDVISTGVDDNLGHGAQKPVALFTELLSRSCKPGDKVLDPFCGTGPIFPAAHAHKVTATGIESSPATYGIALTRLKALA